MTPFQMLTLSLIQGFTEFLPIAESAHLKLILAALKWPTPSDSLSGAISLGSFLGLLVYFRNDWASMISSLLKIIIFRKRPMTLDERLPLFLMISTLPILFSQSSTRFFFTDWYQSPIQVSLLLGASTLPLLFADWIGKKSKGMFDWISWDAIVVGLFQISALLPGWDPLTAGLSAVLFLNYRREVGIRYVYFALAPLLLTETIQKLNGLNLSFQNPPVQLSWFWFVSCVLFSFVIGILSIRGFFQHLVYRGIGHYLFYRLILAISSFLFFWFQNRAGFFS